MASTSRRCPYIWQTDAVQGHERGEELFVTYESSGVLIHQHIAFIQWFFVEIKYIVRWRIVDESLTDIHRFMRDREGAEFSPRGENSLGSDGSPAEEECYQIFFSKPT